MSQAHHPVLDGIAAIAAEYRLLSRRDDFLERLYARIRGNWLGHRPVDRWPSPKNWQLRVAPKFTHDPAGRFEKQLQKQIAVCMENEGWGNDVPTASGLVNSRSRQMNIDLAHRLANGFELIELKIEADDPYKAACQILRYGAVYLLYRLEPELASRFEASEMMRAERIVLEVLAPYPYFSESGVDLPELERQINDQLTDFTESRNTGCRLSFCFRAFPSGFVYRPGIDCDLIRDAVHARSSPFAIAGTQQQSSS